MKYKWTNDALWQTGNVERFLYNTQVQWIYADSLWDYEIKPRFIYGEIAQKFDNQNIKVVVQEREQILDWHLGLLSYKKIYGFSFGTLEKSNLRKIDWRWHAGLGIGWHVLRTSNGNQKINFTTAFLREETDFMNPSQPDYKIFRASIRLKGRHVFFNKHLIINYLFTFLPSIVFDNNRRFASNLSIEIPINKKIQLRSSFDYTYEGIVPPNVKKVDTRTLMGLVIGNI